MIPDLRPLVKSTGLVIAAADNSIGSHDDQLLQYNCILPQCQCLHPQYMTYLLQPYCATFTGAMKAQTLRLSAYHSHERVIEMQHMPYADIAGRPVASSQFLHFEILHV